MVCRKTDIYHISLRDDLSRISRKLVFHASITKSSKVQFPGSNAWKLKIERNKPKCDGEKTSTKNDHAIPHWYDRQEHQWSDANSKIDYCIFLFQWIRNRMAMEITFCTIYPKFICYLYVSSLIINTFPLRIFSSDKFHWIYFLLLAKEAIIDKFSKIGLANCLIHGTIASQLPDDLIQIGRPCVDFMNCFRLRRYCMCRIKITESSIKNATTKTQNKFLIPCFKNWFCVSVVALLNQKFWYCISVILPAAKIKND